MSQFVTQLAKARTVLVLAAVTALVALGGCGGMGDALGVSKRPPDEFAVVAKPPLVVPPEYNLRPPRPGTPRPQELEAQAQAIQALFPDRTEVPPPSAGQQALLRAAGANTVSAGVRSSLNDPTSYVISKGELTGELLQSDIVENQAAQLERTNSTALTDN